MKKLSDVQIFIIGTVLSAVVATVLLALKFSSLESISISLLLGVLIALIKIKADVSKNHDESIEAIGISKGLNADEKFRKAIYDLANKYIEIKTAKPQECLLTEEAQKAVDDCVAAMAELANGRISIDEEHRRQILMCRIVSECTESVNAVTYLSAGHDGWWSGALGRKYFQEQEKAIKERGVKITRIFIVSDQETQNLRDRFTSQINIGVNVRVAERPQLPKPLLRNFLICDDKWVIDSRLDPKGSNDGGSVSKVAAEIHSARDKWAGLMGLSEPIVEVNEYTNPHASTQTPYV
jgi:hypothetical protein